MIPNPVRSIALLAACLLLTVAQPARAQDDIDTQQIRQVIGVYFRGHATANADTMRAAFLPTADACRSLDSLRSLGMTAALTLAVIPSGARDPHLSSRAERAARSGGICTPSRSLARTTWCRFLDSLRSLGMTESRYALRTVRDWCTPSAFAFPTA